VQIGRTDFDEVVARSHDAVFAVNAKGWITAWNGAAERILGYAPRDLIGRPSCDIFRSDEEDGARLCYRGCHATPVRLDPPAQNFELRTRTKSGRPIRLSVSVLSITGRARRRAASLHVLRERMTVSEPTTTLTRRELEILRLMAVGMSSRRAAETLHVSSATVRNHAQSILRKLGVHSRLAAVAFAHRHRLV
jgi:PAS domain S-box-containing protein